MMRLCASTMDSVGLGTGLCLTNNLFGSIIIWWTVWWPIGQPELSESSKFLDVFHQNQTRSGGRTVRLNHEIDCLFPSPFSTQFVSSHSVFGHLFCLPFFTPSLLRLPFVEIPLSLSHSLCFRGYLYRVFRARIFSLSLKSLFSLGDGVLKFRAWTLPLVL